MCGGAGVLLPVRKAPAPRRDVSAAAAAGALVADGDGGSQAPPALFIKKVAGLGIIFLGSTVNYTILQSLRDAIIVTSCGAEALPFINGFCVLPASLAFFLYYDKLVTNFERSPNSVFYWTLVPFAVFYVAFATLILPNVATLHPTWIAEKLGAALPESLSCLVKICANWTYTLFFILGELWGSVAISLLFWSLADDVCTVDEAKTLYPKLGIAANVGLVLAGSFTRFVNNSIACGDSTLSMQVLCSAVVVMAGVMCLAKYFVDSQVRPYLAAAGGKSKKDAKKKKKAEAAAGEGAEQKPDTWAILKSSSKIRDIAIMVMGFGICNKVFGWTWKSEMRKLYPSATEYTTIMGDVASYTGTVTIILMAISKWTFQILKWKGAALATPVVMGLCGGIFFVGSIMGQAAGASQAVGVAALMIAAGPMFGIINQVFGRASKYSLFDPCKEMLFITMTDKREKESGKAAVDILGNQVGKSGGAWVMQGVLLVSGSMSAAMPLTSVFFFGVVAVWVGAALRLARTMQPEERESINKTIDESPRLEPPLPQKVRKAKAPPAPADTASAAAAASAAFAAAAAATNSAPASGAPATNGAPAGGAAATPAEAGQQDIVAAMKAAAADLEVHVGESQEDEEVKEVLQSHFE